MARLGSCEVLRRRGGFEVRCPGGSARVSRDRVLVYAPSGLKAYVQGMRGVAGRVSHIRPVFEPLGESLAEIGLNSPPAGTPEELYRWLERYVEEAEALEELRRSLEVYREVVRRHEELARWARERVAAERRAALARGLP